MQGYNQVTIIGNLTNSPELRTTQSGVAVSEVGIAVNEKRRCPNGNIEEDVYFGQLVFWQKSAEILCQYAKKGTPLFAIGRLRNDQWTDQKTGEKRSKTRIIVDKFRILTFDSASCEERSSGEYHATNGQTSRRPELQRQASAEPRCNSIDDIPF